jgi:serine/threonine-protein kinase
VAVKHFSGARERFAREVEMATRVVHPNIVPIHDIGEDGGFPYYAMELIAGPNLADHLARHGALPPRRAARLVLSLARAVQQIHSLNVVHRDLKPANILLDHTREPHIVDFGLARPLDAPGSEQDEAGALLGTPAYMSPEQAAGLGHLAGPAADVWALGAILYECLTGAPPFRGSTVQEVLRQVGEVAPAPLRVVTRGVPQALEAICLRCLRKEPSRRYRAAAHLAADLRAFLDREGRRRRASRHLCEVA